MNYYPFQGSPYVVPCQVAGRYYGLGFQGLPVVLVGSSLGFRLCGQPSPATKTFKTYLQLKAPSSELIPDLEH